MELQYTVHSYNLGQHSVATKINGEDAQIVQDKIIVELTADDGVQGAIKLVLPASSNFKASNGDKFVVDIKPAKTEVKS